MIKKNNNKRKKTITSRKLKFMESYFQILLFVAQGENILQALVQISPNWEDFIIFKTHPKTLSFLLSLFKKQIKVSFNIFSSHSFLIKTRGCTWLRCRPLKELRQVHESSSITMHSSTFLQKDEWTESFIHKGVFICGGAEGSLLLYKGPSSRSSLWPSSRRILQSLPPLQVRSWSRFLSALRISKIQPSFPTVEFFLATFFVESCAFRCGY